MTKIIPPELIAHLEWDSDRQASRRVQQRTASIDALISNGKVFCSNQIDEGGNWIGVAVALQEAYDQMGNDAIVASLPYLIAGKAKADCLNYLWQEGYNALSEEDVGIDRYGRLVEKGQKIVLTIHGGGILTPDRILEAYEEGLSYWRAAKYSDEEFDNLLKGILPSGESIELYTIDDVKQGRIPKPLGRYGIWMPADTARSISSGSYDKEEFINNELVIARAGTLEYLEEYFDKAKGLLIEEVGNHYELSDINFSQPKGRLLYVLKDYHGINGRIPLEGGGNFVAVAPEAQR